MAVFPQNFTAIFSIFYEFIYRTSVITDADFYRWGYAQGDPTGYGYHGDFINGWANQTALQFAMSSCTNTTAYPNREDNPACSLKVNGTIGELKPQSLDTPAPVDTEIALAGRKAGVA